MLDDSNYEIDASPRTDRPLLDDPKEFRRRPKALRDELDEILDNCLPIKSSTLEEAFQILDAAGRHFADRYLAAIRSEML